MVSLFDLKWNLHNQSSLYDHFRKTISENGKSTIAYLNMHGLYLFYKNKSMHHFLNRSEIYIDGMPIIWLLSFLKYKVSRSHRITWVDWMLPLLKHFEQKSWKVFYLGGAPGVAEQGFSNLVKLVPELKYKVHNGYFNALTDHPENLEVLKKIEAYSPEILIVGMGMPRQEDWILKNLPKIKSNIILPSGAAIEYFAGVVKKPPRWMGQSGLEWLFRLVENPKRFWYRYLIEPWFILTLFFRRRAD